MGRVHGGNHKGVHYNDTAQRKDSGVKNTKHIAHYLASSAVQYTIDYTK
ncbi:DotA protein [Legionella pneumophila subsp. pneumophila LPE509]|nr:DotA protein [Legionella pneumophila subsp. pneumophila LPE509]